MSAQQKPESTAVATIAPSASRSVMDTQIGQILSKDQARAAILPLVPHGVDFEVVVAEAYRQTIKNPEILECTAASIIDAVASVVQTGLVIGRTVHLVPVRDNKKNVTQLQAWNDYKGDIELVLRSGAARSVYANAVYANEITRDRFSVELGSTPTIAHRPILDPSKRGSLAGAYGVAVIDAYGRIKVVQWMPLADIEKIRAGSRGWKPEKVKDCPEWYAIKTVFHKLCKTLPKSERLAKALAIMERQDQQDIEEIDAEITDASSDRPALAKADADGVALASTPQKIRIFELLDTVDVDQPTRDAKWATASAATFTSDAADAMIAELEKLTPPRGFDQTSEE